METTSPYHINCDDIILEERIGRGTFSVFKAKVEGNTVAVKIIDCNKNQIPQEVEVYNQIFHLNFFQNLLEISHIAHSKDGFSIYICMELADKSLYQYLHDEEKKPSLQTSIKWAIQIAMGMHHLHQHGLAHRNLKSTNVLLFENKDVLKVCDIGSAHPPEKTGTLSEMAGSYRWMAPEFHKRADTKKSQCCDIFSYGMILYEIFAHKIPFSNIHKDVDVVTSIRDGKRPFLPRELPLGAKKLVQSCWKQEPHDRPTFTQILEVGSLQISRK